VTATEFASLEAGAIVERRHDRSRWRVTSVTSREREDTGSQRTMGSIVSVAMRRVSPEFITSHEPLTWENVEQDGLES